MRVTNNVGDFLVTYPAVKETPSGSKNGTNKNFTVNAAPLVFCEFFKIDVSGVQSKLTISSISGTTVTLSDAPISTDTLVSFSL